MGVTVLDFALELAEQKVRLFPVCPNSKIPSISDFPKRATNDPKKLKTFFGNGALNSGIACGFVAEGLYLVGFDIDNKPGKPGYETLENLRKMGREFPQTWTQKTPTGGEHRLYWSPHPIKQGTNICGPGIDLRSDGGYLVGPGSSIHGKLYEPVNRTPIIQFPEWAVELYKKTAAKILTLPTPTALPPQDQVLALKRAVEYLHALAPATQGGRNDYGYKVVCKLKDFGVAQDQMGAVLLTHWKCEPMLEEAEINHLIHSAFRYGTNSFGVEAPEHQFPDDIQSAIDTTNSGEVSSSLQKTRDIIGEINEKHLVVNENGKALIYRESFDPILNRASLQRFSFEDFKKIHCNEFVQKGNKIVPAATAWLESPRRRQFLDGVVFDPTNKCSKDNYNLWRGWAIDPKEGEFPLIERFLQEVICDNDAELYSYLTGWLARMFQYPEKPGEVALVFKGLKGTGKSTLAEFLLDIMGQHGMEISQPGQLTGRFLSHLRDAVFVVANESFWSGDRQAEGQLKSIITNKYLSLEGKFQAPITVKNVVHLMFTTNDDWAVPASMGDERRFAVFEVGRQYMQDRKYFATLRDEAYNRGGLAAMLHYFLSYDIEDFDVADMPKNPALADQKLRSLRGPDKWLHESLSLESIAGWEWGDATLEISKKVLYEDYCKWSDRNEYYPASSVQWSASLRKLLGPCFDQRKPHRGSPVVGIAPLEGCRKQFEKTVKHEVDWGDAPYVEEEKFDDLL